MGILVDFVVFFGGGVEVGIHAVHFHVAPSNNPKFINLFSVLYGFMYEVSTVMSPSTLCVRDPVLMCRGWECERLEFDNAMGILPRVAGRWRSTSLHYLIREH